MTPLPYCISINWTDVQQVGGFDPAGMYWNFVYLVLAMLPLIIIISVVAFILYSVPPPIVPSHPWHRRPPK